jgi:hypothetical protein
VAHTSRITFHASRFTHHVSRITFHASRFTHRLPVSPQPVSAFEIPHLISQTGTKSAVNAISDLHAHGFVTLPDIERIC